MVGFLRDFSRFGLRVSFRRFGDIGFRTSRIRIGPSWLLAQILYAAVRRHDVSQIVVVLFQLHKVGDIEEGIALQADVDEGRLHAREHPGYAAFVDGSS